MIVLEKKFKLIFQIVVPFIGLLIAVIFAGYTVFLAIISIRTIGVGTPSISAIISLIPYGFVSLIGILFFANLFKPWFLNIILGIMEKTSKDFVENKLSKWLLPEEKLLFVQHTAQVSFGPSLYFRPAYLTNFRIITPGTTGGAFVIKFVYLVQSFFYSKSEAAPAFSYSVTGVESGVSDSGNEFIELHVKPRHPTSFTIFSSMKLYFSGAKEWAKEISK